MAGTSVFRAGGYRYIPGPFQYSGGVAAEPGCAIHRARFRQPVPLEEGFARIEAHLKATGRPLTSLCACELRSPGQFSAQGFVDFNRRYVAILERWGIVSGDDNPVARSNVCPDLDAPAEPSVHAFSYTVTAGEDWYPSFVIAGSAEVREGAEPYEERFIRRGDTSPEALLEKARHVLTTMERRMAACGVTWRDATATQAYTVHDLHPFLADEIVARGAAAAGLTWVYARPPVVGLEFEIDVRGVEAEYTLAGWAPR
ncbi:MAG: hypothetical protein AB7P99_02530 [Vicinamibacterales bacterium]